MPKILRRKLDEDQLYVLRLSLEGMQHELNHRKPRAAADDVVSHRKLAAKLLIGHFTDFADVAATEPEIVGVDARDLALYKQVAAIIDGFEIPKHKNWDTGDHERLRRHFDKLRAFWKKITGERYRGLPNLAKYLKVQHG